MVRINGQAKILKQNDTLHIPKNTIHGMWNNGDEKAVVHCRVQPAMNTEYLLETGMGLAQDGKAKNHGMPVFLQAVLIADKFSAVYRLPKPPFAVQKVLFTLLKPIAYLTGHRPTYRKYLD